MSPKAANAKLFFWMNEIGKALVVLGIALVIVGGLLWLGFGKWIGKLPGDIHYTRGNFSFNFPIVTCVLVSIVLTILLWLFQRSK